MSEIKTFEDLDAWQVARELSRWVYDMTRNAGFRRDFGLADQIRRAVASVLSNIAEGFERGSNRKFARFLFIAKASAGEVRSLLYVALDQGYISAQEFDTCRDLAIRAAKTIWGLIRFLRAKSDWVTGLKILFLALTASLSASTFLVRL